MRSDGPAANDAASRGTSPAQSDVGSGFNTPRRSARRRGPPLSPLPDPSARPVGVQDLQNATRSDLDEGQHAPPVVVAKESTSYGASVSTTAVEIDRIAGDNDVLTGLRGLMPNGADVPNDGNGSQSKRPLSQ